MTITNKDAELLMRRVSGRLDKQASSALERRLADEPELRQVLHDFEATWARLGVLASTEEALEDLKQPIMERIRVEVKADEQGLVVWAAAPQWARAGSVMSLAAGLVLGIFLAMPSPGSLPAIEEELSFSTPESDESLFGSSEPTLADAYWQALDAAGGRLTLPTEGDES